MQTPSSLATVEETASLLHGGKKHHHHIYAKLWYTARVHSRNVPMLDIWFLRYHVFFFLIYFNIPK